MVISVKSHLTASSATYMTKRAIYVTERGGIERCEVASGGVP